jgi:DMSO/TMAO reductase YedYZ molybdopterin-dependent catalytic subunit
VTDQLDRFLAEHIAVSRRYFLGAGAAGVAALSAWPLLAAEAARDARLDEALAKLESFLTLPDDFRDVSRGKPVPHSLPEEKRTEVGLTRETWKLEVTTDPENPSKIRSPLTIADSTALDFAGLMKLAEQHAVRFPKVMTCLNIGCPLGMGIWEGVPLREVLWLTQPREDLRRVYYYGYHNDDEKQMFRSSLPAGRILEDPYDLPPVILCYKLNGQWLTPERGGPVRVVVPEGYGFKSIKWLTNIVLTNLYHANDTYASGNNDVDSSLKSFAATLSIPGKVKPGEPIPVTGYAQVGISGLTKVQVWMQRDGQEWPIDDRYFATAPWRDAEILPPPAPGKWGGGLADEALLADTMHFDEQGRPKVWPLRLGKVHWAALLPGLPAGDYTFRSRTVDDKGIGQPLPRPFRKSGHSAIEEVSVAVKE